MVINQGATASQHHDQQKGGDRYYIILILLNKSLLSTKLLATVSLHHLGVQNNKQSILWWVRQLLLPVTRRKMKINCTYLPPKLHYFFIHIDRIFIKSQFLSC